MPLGPETNEEKGRGRGHAKRGIYWPNAKNQQIARDRETPTETETQTETDRQTRRIAFWLGTWRKNIYYLNSSIITCNICIRGRVCWFKMEQKWSKLTGKNFIGHEKE